MSIDKYRPYIGLDYVQPNGCFRLVETVFLELYGVDLNNPDEGLKEESESKDKTKIVLSSIARLSRQVYEPKEGDVVLIKSRPWHIGVVVGDGFMLHNYSKNGTSCIEEYNSLRWKKRIEGFYRYKGFK